MTFRYLFCWRAVFRGLDVADEGFVFSKSNFRSAFDRPAAPDCPSARSRAALLCCSSAKYGVPSLVRRIRPRNARPGGGGRPDEPHPPIGTLPVRYSRSRTPERPNPDKVDQRAIAHTLLTLEVMLASGRCIAAVFRRRCEARRHEATEKSRSAGVRQPERCPYAASRSSVAPCLAACGHSRTAARICVGSVVATRLGPVRNRSWRAESCRNVTPRESVGQLCGADDRARSSAANSAQ
jgi:hypothetical protein